MILGASLFFVFLVIFCASILCVFSFLFPVLRDSGKTIVLPFFDFDVHSQISEDALESKLQDDFRMRKAECKILRSFYDESGKDLISLYNDFSECVTACPRFAAGDAGVGAVWRCPLAEPDSAQSSDSPLIVTTTRGQTVKG
ncbi:MAG: hypothetical protein Ta2A_20530 [Treponemataceae bacterium]|nr:MAG: hypothetical protein Ta2A_20530 [Treponemataceae bacterium]